MSSLSNPGSNHITGYESALLSVYGYLRFVLPGFRQQLITRLHPDVAKRCVKKFLIIVPQTCVCPALLAFGERLKHADMYVPITVSRAGQKNRDFKVSLYKLTYFENNEEFYLPAVFANSVQSLYDIYSCGMSGMTVDQLRRERNRFLLHQQQLLAGRYEGEYRLLYWKDEQLGENEKAKNLYIYLLQVARQELPMERCGVGSCNQLSDSKCKEKQIDLAGGEDGVRWVDIPGTNPASQYATEFYTMRNEPRGICIIINISQFGTTAASSAGGQRAAQEVLREGSDVDANNLKKLFSWLKFVVRVYGDEINEDELWRILELNCREDHGEYDAFVCCIMSHGQLGSICCSDRRAVRILDIAEKFNNENCPSLIGKPKMFFIQACQGTSDVFLAGNENVNETEENQIQADAEPFDGNDTRSTGISAQTSLLLPKSPDFLMSYSTVPGRFSYRHPDQGTFYVQELVESLKKGFEVEHSLNCVRRNVKQRMTAISGFTVDNQQIPFHFANESFKAVYLCGSPVTLPGALVQKGQISAADSVHSNAATVHVVPVLQESRKENLGDMTRNVTRNTNTTSQPTVADSQRRCVQQPSDPFDFHLYVGYCDRDAPRMATLIKYLASECRLLCTTRFSRRNDGTNADDCIRNGVEFSQQCLLYLSANSTTDIWFRVELTAALEKLENFGRDMVIIVKDPLLGMESIPKEIADVRTVSIDDVMSPAFRTTLSSPPAIRSIPALPSHITGHLEAFAYYCSFVRFVLADFGERMKEKLACLLRQAAANDASSRRPPKALAKMLILVAESCNAPPQIDDGRNVVHAGFLSLHGNRVGDKNRDYKTPLFRLVDGEDELYFSGEFPACLLTMFEVIRDGRSGLSVDDIPRLRNVFCQSLDAILSHPDNAAFHNQYLLLVWPDAQKNNVSGKPKVDLYDFLRANLVEETRRENLLATSDFSTAAPCGLRDMENTVAQRFVSQSPGDVFEVSTIGTYQLSGKRRGICVIINITSGDGERQNRENGDDGSLVMTLLADLFGKRLGFAVKAVTGCLTKTELDAELAGLCNRNHATFEAFACCIIAPGKPGWIRTGDGLESRILEVVELFGDTHCPSLSGKPKLFFVVAQTSEIDRLETDDDQTQQLKIDLSGQNGEEVVAKTCESERGCTSTTPDGHCERNFAGLLSSNKSDSDPASRHAVDSNVAALETNSDPVEMNSTDEQGCLTDQIDGHQPPLIDALVFAETVSRELLIPGLPDIVISYASIPTRLSLEYVRMLVDNLQTNVNAVRALTDVGLRFRRRSRELGVELSAESVLCVSTADKLVMFGPRS